MSGTLPGARDIAVNKTKFPVLTGLTSWCVCEGVTDKQKINSIERGKVTNAVQR